MLVLFTETSLPLDPSKLVLGTATQGINSAKFDLNNSAIGADSAI